MGKATVCSRGRREETKAGLEKAAFTSTVEGEGERILL